MNEIDAGDLAKRVSGGEKLTLIDVRTPAEYSGAHIAGSQNLPLGSAELGQFSNEPDATVVLVCQGGKRAATACEEFTRRGLQKAIVLRGGVNAWRAAALPLVEGRGVISLERQVRIAAGVLVVLGVLLGALANSAWYGLSAFVGCGLVFAGVTDTCGMAMILARMPWNRAGGAPQCQR